MFADKMFARFAKVLRDTKLVYDANVIQQADQAHAQSANTLGGGAAAVQYVRNNSPDTETALTHYTNIEALKLLPDDATKLRKIHDEKGKALREGYILAEYEKHNIRYSIAKKIVSDCAGFCDKRSDAKEAYEQQKRRTNVFGLFGF